MFLCVIVLVIHFLHSTSFRNKVSFPTSGIRALIRVEVMTGEDGKTSGIEKFDGTDFGYWKMQIEDLFGISLLQAHISMTMKKKKKM